MIGRPARHPVHLWVYNHPVQMISDQIEFFFLIMQQNGYPVTMGRNPKDTALNVVIENFSEMTSRTLIDYCERTGKRVAVIMTEHLDLVGDELFIHGDRLWNNNDYMHPATQVSRIKNLMDCVPYFRAVFVLGDLPELIGSGSMFPGLTVRTLPFPELVSVDLTNQEPMHEVVFSGALTAFRDQTLRAIAERFVLAQTSKFLPRKGRDRLNESARVVLNIPQRPNWRWLSLMRIIAALRCGRATVSIGTQDQSCIAECCIQLHEVEWEDELRRVVNNWPHAYQDCLTRYESMRQSFLAKHRFPNDLMEYWSLLERLDT